MTYLELKTDKEIVTILDQLPQDRNYFNRAWSHSILNDAPNKKEFIIKALQLTLDEYTATKPTTKCGKIARFIAKIASVLSRIVKI
jgi:3-methyladenine DNA glycosylase AlkC